MESASSPAARPAAGAARWLLVPLVAAVLLVGVVLVVGQLAPGSNNVKVALAVAWFVAAGAVLGKLAKERPALKMPFRASVLLAAALLGGWYLNSLREEDVQEQLVTPVAAPQAGADSGQQPGQPANEGAQLLAAGDFGPREHAGEGRAEVVRSEGGKLTLQLRDFRTDAGPDLRVYLATDGDAGEFKDLGGLTGNSGSQRYNVPKGTETGKYDTVVIWCRAFTVAFAEAPLSAR